MDLSPGQQRLVFVVVVLALAGLGIYLLSNRGSGGGSSAAPSPRASTAAPAPATGTDAGVPPATVPPPAPVSTAGGAQIYQWLPFTPADLNQATKTTLSFAANYATWSYTEDKAAYGAKLSGLVTATEATSLVNAYMTPGVASARTQGKQVSSGTGTIDSITTIGAGTGGPSITFAVTINQRVTSAGQPAQVSNSQYDVTVASSGGSWQVNDIELSGLGNH